MHSSISLRQALPTKAHTPEQTSVDNKSKGELHFKNNIALIPKINIFKSLANNTFIWIQK